MPKINRTLLIVPPTGKYIREDRCQTPIKDLKTVALRPPIDLLYCAAHFERGGSACRLVDYPAEDKGWADLEHDLREFKPEILVLSITTPSLSADLQAARVAKQVDPAIRVGAKGAHFNVYDVKTLEEYPELDFVFRGEYEPAAEEIARGTDWSAIAGITWRDTRVSRAGNMDKLDGMDGMHGMDGITRRAPMPAASFTSSSSSISSIPSTSTNTTPGAIRRNPDRGYIEDLDALAFPARHLVKNELYIRPDNGAMQTTIITNRGCPFTCIYCLAPLVGGRKNRYRSVENVIAEIEECVHKYHIRSFLFRSDLFTQSKGWVHRLCNAIIERKLDIDWACNSRVDTIREEILPLMKQAGCWIIAYGVESGLAETLEKIEKKATAEQARRAVALTRAAGIYASVYMLMGLPWETEEHIKQNIEFFVELDADFVEIFYAYPFPGTAYHKLLVEQGLLQDGEIPKEAYGRPAHDALHLTREQLAGWRRKALRRLYMRPSYVWQTLKKSRSPMEALQYLRHGLIQLRDLVVGS